MLTPSPLRKSQRMPQSIAVRMDAAYACGTERLAVKPATAVAAAATVAAAIAASKTANIAATEAAAIAAAWALDHQVYAGAHGVWNGRACVARGLRGAAQLGAQMCIWAGRLVFKATTAFATVGVAIVSWRARLTWFTHFPWSARLLSRCCTAWVIA